MPLGFAPLRWFPVAILTIAYLFLGWLNLSPKRAALFGFLFGLGMFGVGVSWVYVSLHNFGNMSPLLAGVAVLLFVAILSLYPALLGYLQARYFTKIAPILRLTLVMPAMWVLFEWWRGWFLTGFPWLNIGYSQSDTVLVGFAPLLGVYGVGLITTIISGLIAAIYMARAQRLICVIAIALFWLAGFFANKIEWVEPHGEPIKTALIQGNIPITDKWQPLKQRDILKRYLHLSTPQKDALIIWPEAAIPFELEMLEPWFLNALQESIKENRNEFLIGIIEGSQVNGTRHYYNSIVRFPGKISYRKQHLVPFGEFIPFKPIFSWLLQHLHIPMSDLSAGKGNNQIMSIAGLKAGLSICYEDVFGEELARALPKATILINVSEDAWFGRSLGPHQRMQMARLRAIELGRPILRVGNGGFSGVINHQGHIVRKSVNFRTDIVSAHVQPMQGITPYAQWRNTPAILFTLLLPGLALLRRHKNYGSLREHRAAE